MSQSEWLAAILIAGFVLWLAMNNRLGVYWSLLLGGGPAPPPPTGNAPSTIAPGSGTGTGTQPPLKFTVPGQPANP
jgi:hypothetical protein